jgi:hypothetical protein
MAEELWRVIPDFPDYMISSYGNVFNRKLNTIVVPSLNQYNDVKITLRRDRESKTVLVRNLVAREFIPNDREFFQTVVHIDGNHKNVSVNNLVWRPRWFAWKYSHQFTEIDMFPQYHTIPVHNLANGMNYDSIVDAGMADVVLFKDVLMSAYNGNKVFPDQGPYVFIE